MKDGGATVREPPPFFFLSNMTGNTGGIISRLVKIKKPSEPFPERKKVRMVFHW